MSLSSLPLPASGIRPPYGFNVIEPVLEQHFRLICQVLARYGFRYRPQSTLGNASDRRLRARVWHGPNGYAQFSIELCCNLFAYRNGDIDALRLHVGMQLVTHHDGRDSTEPLLRTVSVECGPPSQLPTKTENLRRFLAQHFDASIVASIVNERMSN